jgi:hypothetical protein
MSATSEPSESADVALEAQAVFVDEAGKVRHVPLRGYDDDALATPVPNEWPSDTKWQGDLIADTAYVLVRANADHEVPIVELNGLDVYQASVGLADNSDAPLPRDRAQHLFVDTNERSRPLHVVLGAIVEHNAFCHAPLTYEFKPVDTLPQSGTLEWANEYDAAVKCKWLDGTAGSGVAPGPLLTTLRRVTRSFPTLYDAAPAASEDVKRPITCWTLKISTGSFSCSLYFYPSRPNFVTSEIIAQDRARYVQYANEQAVTCVRLWGPRIRFKLVDEPASPQSVDRHFVSSKHMYRGSSMQYMKEQERIFQAVENAPDQVNRLAEPTSSVPLGLMPMQLYDYPPSKASCIVKDASERAGLARNDVAVSSELFCKVHRASERADRALLLFARLCRLMRNTTSRDAVVSARAALRCALDTLAPIKDDSNLLKEWTRQESRVHAFSHWLTANTTRAGFATAMLVAEAPLQNRVCMQRYLDAVSAIATHDLSEADRNMVGLFTQALEFAALADRTHVEPSEGAAPTLAQTRRSFLGSIVYVYPDNSSKKPQLSKAIEMMPRRAICYVPMGASTLAWSRDSARQYNHVWRTGTVARLAENATVSETVRVRVRYGHPGDARSAFEMGFKRLDDEKRLCELAIVLASHDDPRDCHARAFNIERLERAFSVALAFGARNVQVIDTGAAASDDISLEYGKLADCVRFAARFVREPYGSDAALLYVTVGDASRDSEVVRDLAQLTWRRVSSPSDRCPEVEDAHFAALSGLIQESQESSTWPMGSARAFSSTKIEFKYRGATVDAFALSGNVSIRVDGSWYTNDRACTLFTLAQATPSS